MTSYKITREATEVELLKQKYINLVQDLRYSHRFLWKVVFFFVWFSHERQISQTGAMVSVSYGKKYI